MKNRSISIILILVLLLSGCSMPTDNKKTTEDNAVQTDSASLAVSRPDYFGLAYYPNENVNPVFSRSKLNHTLTKLCFEGLFELNNEFQPQNVLCESYATTDGLKYTFTIKSGIKFQSGKTLTARDVAYTYNAARTDEKSIYRSRLSNISSVKAVSDTTLTVTQKTANTSLPALLDIPVFRQGSESDKFSDGTGPYMPVNEDAKQYLKPFVGWHGSSAMAYDRIDLVTTIRSDAVVYSFETGDISMTQAARISSTPMSFRGAVEIKTVPSTDFHYLGVNCNKTPYTAETVRQALSAMLARADIVKNQLQECADAAVLPVNPQPKDMGDKLNLAKDNTKALALLAQSGISDTDGDGFLDFAGPTGRRHPFEPVILVNDDNTYKAAVLERYVGDLQAAGIHASVKAVSFEEYQTALAKGDFDLYYGETELAPDFNIIPLVGTGGALNFGKYRNPIVDSALAGSMAATGDGAASAHKALYEQLLTSMPIIPIAFTKTQVISRQGLADGIDPWPYDIFHGIGKWTKKK